MSGDKRERIVIVGAGAAGLRAAERLRELHFEGELVIVSEEPYRPYHRPALCKQLLTGSLRSKDITLPLHSELDAVWRYGVRANRLDTEEHVVHLPGGEDLRYDGLVIATGTQARHLPGAPRQDPRVQVLRTIADAAAVKKAIAHSRNGVAVIGGGFISCEVASAARELGRDATIIVREQRLLDRVPGEGFGEAVAELHRTHGVQVVTQATVRHWVPQSDGMAMHLSNGQVVLASCVVLGIGAVPAVDWMRGSGLILDDGVMCDPTCHAVGASDVVVAGDIARWPNLLYDTVPRRVEHWLNAIEMGRAAAENLLDGKDSAKPYTPMPRFWSEQHGVRIQAAGVPALASDTVSLSGSVTVGHRVTGYVNGGSLVGVVGWDSPRGMIRWTGELEHQLTTAMRRRTPTPGRQSRPVERRPEPIRADFDTTITDHRVRELVVAGARGAGQAQPLDPPSLANLGPVAELPPVNEMPNVPRPSTPRTRRPVNNLPSRPPRGPIEELPPVPRGRMDQPSMPPVPPIPPPPPNRPGPVDHPSFPRMRPAAPPRMDRTAPPARPHQPAADHPSFPRMRPVEPPRTNRPAADHPSFPRMQPVEPPAGPPRRTPAAPPAGPPRVAPPKPPRPEDHPSFPRMRPAEPPMLGRAEPPVRPLYPTADHPSFPRMQPVEPPSLDRTEPSVQPLYPAAGHPSFPRMRPVEPPRTDRAAPPARPLHPAADHPSFPRMQPVEPPAGPPRRSPAAPPARPLYPTADHPSFPRMRPVEPPRPAPAAPPHTPPAPPLRTPPLTPPRMGPATPRTGPGPVTPPRPPYPPVEHPSFPRMRPVDPPDVRRPGEPPLNAAEITMPSLENLRIPDYLPDMSTLRPAEQSWPRLQPVEPPPNVRVPELSMPGMRTPGVREPDRRSPGLRDLFD